MKQPHQISDRISDRISDSGLRRAVTRDLDGARRLSVRAEDTRCRELGRLLEFAVGRRLRRSTPAASGTVDAPAQDAPRLLTRTAVTGDLLRLTVSRPAGFRYRPGQHVKMGLPGLLRTYSLVSAPHEPQLEFFVEVLPGGGLSERLRTLRPGARMRLAERAKGDLRLDGRYANQLLIATVTGIAPYVSLVRDHVHRAPAAPRRLIVLHGASHADELGYRDELMGLARRQPGTVVYVPTVSRPESARNAGWSGARGRVESQIEGVLTRFALTPDDTAVFACGQPEMVRSVAGDFRRRRFTTYTEPFD